jgi:hypothetical protein
MKLPHPGRAVVEIEKLRDYCLSMSHPRGRHKAKVFESVLGITADDAEELRQALLSGTLVGRNSYALCLIFHLNGTVGERSSEAVGLFVLMRKMCALPVVMCYRS